MTITAPNGLNGDVLTTGRDVRLQTQVAGDVALAGSTVELVQPVQGYVMAAASTVDVAGSVADDLWAAGADVRVRAPIHDNANLAGKELVIEREARVGRDARLAGMTVDVRAPIGRNLKIAASEARLSSEVQGSAEAYVDELQVLPGAIVRGDLFVRSAHAPEIASDAQILGRVERRDPRDAWMREYGLLDWLGRYAFLLLALMLLGSATIALAGPWPRQVASTIRQRPGRSMLVGVAGLVLTPIACALFALSLFGAPLAVVLLALYVVALLLAGVFVADLLGAFVLTRLGSASPSPYARLAAGALIVALFVSLPLIGWFAQLLIFVLGLGALLVERRLALGRVWQGA